MSRVSVKLGELVLQLVNKDAYSNINSVHKMENESES